MLIKVRNFRTKTHHAEFVRNEDIAKIYRLWCTGQEIRMGGIIQRWYFVAGRPVSCKRCIKKREKIIENAVASGILSEPIEEARP